MMKCVAVVGQKGGAGKTTLATCLADWLHHEEGVRVMLLDADPQGTAQHWADVAAEREVEGPPVLGTRGKALAKAVAAVAETADFVVLDTPPRFGTESKAALMVADLVLVPVAPGPADVWALGETASVLEEAAAFRGEISALVVLNRADTRTAIANAVREGADETGLEVLSETLGNRVAFPEAQAAGQGVCSYAASSTAADEVRALGKALRARLR